MRDLDREETYIVDRTGLTLELRDLVGTGHVPGEAYTGPHAALGYGERQFAALLSGLPDLG